VGSGGWVSPGLDNLNGYLYGTAKPSYRNPPTFFVNYTVPGKFKVAVGIVSSWGINTLTILLDGSTTVVDNIPVSEGSTYEINVPAGLHTIRVEHSGEDWFQVLLYTLTDYTGILRNFSLKGTSRILGWIQNRHYTYWAQYSGTPLPTVSDGVINLTGLSADGTWDVQWWDTLNGSVLSTGTVLISGGNGSLPIPSMNSDIAFKMMPAILPVPIKTVLLLLSVGFFLWCKSLILRDNS